MCEMDFLLMPFDRQECFARLSTYVEDNTTVRLQPTEGHPALINASDQYLMQSDVEWTFGTDPEDTHRAYSEGRYPVLDLRFHLERSPRSYMTSAVHPVVMIVAFAYLSFWIARSAVPARTAIASASGAHCAPTARRASGAPARGATASRLLPLPIHVHRRAAQVVICYLNLENKLVAVSSQLPKVQYDPWLIRFCTVSRCIAAATRTPSFPPMGL